MGIFRRNNYNTVRDVEDGGLPALLRTYGGTGGARNRVQDLHVAKQAKANKDSLPSLVAKIYAPTAVRVPDQPYEAGAVPGASLVNRIYDVNNGGK